MLVNNNNNPGRISSYLYLFVTTVKTNQTNQITSEVIYSELPIAGDSSTIAHLRFGRHLKIGKWERFIMEK